MNSLLSAALGGTLIGLAATWLWWARGRAAGISGILGGVFDEDRGWRIAFVSGLIAGGLVLLIASPGVFGVASSRPLPALAAAGLLVGYGTRLGGGCTSGHGICGVSRGSLRSGVATAVFLTVGIVVATFVGQLGGAA